MSVTLPPDRPAADVPLRLHIALAVVVALALLGPLLVVLHAPRIAPADRALAAIVHPKRVVPRTELPSVDPVEIARLPMDRARAFNAAIPFVGGPNPAARAFVLSGSEADRGRAIDCLAAATWYEAGDDAVGQRAVAQVILNRARHPAYPNSICGVVFQGQERRTGCQFTFTCDGAMARSPSPAAWARAQDIARRALSGEVYAKVGHSTHYHTDWVVPYWSASLDKVAEVHTHLFFRWTGWWGTPGAFRRTYAGAEPVIAKMARLSPLHRVAVVEAGLSSVDGMIDPASIPETAVPKPVTAGEPDTFHVALDRKLGEDGYAALAIRTCGDRPYCKFLGWTDPRKVPPAGATPSTAQLEAMSFSYLRDQAQGYGKALWNCAEFRRASPVQCMRRTPTVSSADEAKGDAPQAVKRAGVPDGLSGVRRKGDAAVAAPATDPVAKAGSAPAAN